MAKDEDIVLTPGEDGGVIVELDGTPPVTTQPAKVAEELAANEADRKALEAAEAAAAAPVTPEPVSEAVEELRAQLKASADREAASNRDRMRAEQERNAHQAEALRYQEESKRQQTEVQESRRSEIDSAILASAAEAESARREYQTALEGGDFKSASDANLKVNRAVAQQVFLEDRKATFENAPRPIMHPAGRVEAQPEQPAVSDPIEQFIQTRTPRTQQWLRKHTECVTDTQKNDKTVAAHYEAKSEGYVPDSDAYFDYLDRKLGFAQPIAATAAAAPVARVTEPAKPAKAPPPAAPVSREAPRANELGSGRIYLSRSELEVAEALGLSPAEYGKRKQAMTKQGFYH